MSNKLFKTNLKSGTPIEVYRTSSGEWVSYADCNTVYLENELIITKEMRS